MNLLFRHTVLVWVALAALGAPLAHAQRQMENLGRGMLVLRTSSTETYIGWRLLGNDPQDIAFNLYRSANGGTAVKVNGGPLTATTDYVDTPPNFSSTAYTYFVRPVLNGMEVVDSWANPVSGPASLPVNAPVRQYRPLTLQPTPDEPASNANYRVKFAWAGDIDGDGEYDFVVERTNSAAVSRQWLQAYKGDGTLLWQMTQGPNSLEQDHIYPGSSAIAVGQSDNVTVYDLDGDGRAEVCVLTANGVVFNYGAPGQTTLTAPDNEVQFISIIDGMTGAEKARAQVPIPAGWVNQGNVSGHMGVFYHDGLRPSLFFHAKNRNPDLSFNNLAAAWDYRDGTLVRRWLWDAVAESGHTAEAHQIRFADVDNDGTDEYVDIGHVLKSDGSGLINGDRFTEVIHGDRFHVADIDPAHPGLETFLIQQDNPSGLTMAYQAADRSRVIKKWYAGSIIDVGRGTVGGFVPNLFGLQFFSTTGGTFDAKGNQIYATAPFPPETIWWDADLGREFLSTIGNSATSPGIDKFNPANAGSSRLLTLYSDPAAPGYPYNNYIANGGRPQFWGDILGDWREELVCVATDNSELRIYTTRTPDVAKSYDGTPFRIHTLMHDPQYRVQTTTKGYVQSSYPSYYLGYGMPPPPPPPMVPASLVWAGGAGASVWSTGPVAAWKNSSASAASAFSNGRSVRFDLSGSNATSVALSGELMPGDVTVYSPKDYIFDGSAGSLAGSMRLVKAGKGALRLTGDHCYVGATTVWDGALRVDGSLSGSAVTVWGGTWGGAAARGLSGGRLAGSGSVARPVTLRYRGALTPGAGMGSAGVLSLGAGLSARDGSVLAFDLSSDPSGTVRPNDRLAITGNLSLAGSVTLLVNPTEGRLAPGTYTLVTYTGSLVGSLSNLAVDVPEGTPHTVALGSGALTLTIPVTRAADAVSWTGAASSAWDITGAANWSLDGSPTAFIAGDSVAFGDTGAARTAIVLNSSMPMAGMTVSGSANYTFSGPGAISGNGGLVKTGPGVLTLSTTNTFTGPVSIRGGAVAVSSLGDAELPGSLGASSASAANLLVDGGTLRLVGPQTSTNRNLTLGSSGGAIDIASAGGSIQISGAIGGPGKLTKAGPGTLLLASANSYSGGTVINGGKIYLAGSAANEGGLGSGDITINNGTLSMADVQNNDVAAWNIIVPDGDVARLDADGRCSLVGTLSGSGSLTYFSPYVRSDLRGNWSAFFGRILHIGGDFRVANTFGYANAALDLGADTYASYVLTTASTGTTVPVGELSGASTAILAGGPTGGRTLTWQIGARNTDSTFAGSIRNSGGTTALTKVGSGSLVLSGNHTYTGATTVSAGKLVLAGGALSGNGTIGTAVTVAAGAGFGGSGSVVGGVSFGTGSVILANPAAPLAITGNLAISGGVSVAPAPGAALAPGTYPLITYTGSLTGSPVFVWNGPGFTAAFNTAAPGQITYTLAADNARPVSSLVWTGASSAVWDAAAANWTHEGGATAFKDGDAVALTDAGSVTTLTLYGALRPASVMVNASKNYALSGSGQLAGDAALTKSGAGTLTLSTANSHLGGVTLQAGTLVLGHASALGTGTLTLSGGTLDTGALAIGNLIRITGSTTILGGDAAGAQGLGGVISGAADTLTLSSASVFDIEGNLAPFTGRVALAGAGSFRLNGSSGSAFAEWSLGNRTLTARSGSSFALGALSGSAGSLLNNSTSNSGNVTYAVGALGRDTAFAGVIANGNSTRATALTKVGAGSLTLSGNHTYTGATTVSAGSLLVTGALGATPASVSAGATLGGTGSLGGNLTLAAGSRLALGLGATSTRGLSVGGATTIEGEVTVVPALLGGALAPGTYPLISYTGALAGAPSFSWLDTTGSGYAAAFETAAPGLVKITLVAPPGIPAGLMAAAGNGRVDLAWNAVPGADSYTVLRSTGSGSGYVVVASGLTTTRYADTGRPNGVAARYVVTATNLAGTSAWSREASALPRATAPANFAASAGNARVDLTWSPVPGSNGYVLMRAIAPGGDRQTIATNLTTTAYADTGLANGSVYYYVVAALDAAGSGPVSEEASATPVLPLSLIETWRVSHFANSGGLDDGADLADPDGDGFVNLLEYALGTTPTAASAPAYQLSRGNGVLKLTFPRIADPALTYVVQGSGDLSEWTDLWTSSGNENITGPVTVADSVPLDGSARRFLRLRVSISP